MVEISKSGSGEDLGWATGPGCSTAADVYLMFPSMFHHAEDTVDVQLAVSRDGATWQRVGDRKPFIPCGIEGAFDHFQIYTSVGIVRTMDELFLYYYCHYSGHDATMNKDFTSTFSRVRIRLDGFISVDTNSRGGTLTTPPLIFSGIIWS